MTTSVSRNNLLWLVIKCYLLSLAELVCVLYWSVRFLPLFLSFFLFHFYHFTFLFNPFFFFHHFSLHWLIKNSLFNLATLSYCLITVCFSSCSVVVEAAEKQMKNLWHTTNIYMHPTLHQYASELVAKLPSNLKVVFCSFSLNVLINTATFKHRHHLMLVYLSFIKPAYKFQY